MAVRVARITRARCCCIAQNHTVPARRQAAWLVISSGMSRVDSAGVVDGALQSAVDRCCKGQHCANYSQQQVLCP